MWVNCLTHTVTHIGCKLYPRKWTRDFDPWPRSADTHLTHRVSQWLCRLLPAHALWVRGNIPIDLKSTGEEAFAFSLVFLAFFCLHDLRHEAAHRLCCLVLLLPCSVGVGAESESGVIVAEHTADGFDVHAILQCQRCEGMSEIMKADMLQSRVLEDFLMEVYH